MIEDDTIFNDIDDTYINSGSSDLLYSHWFPTEPGWDQHSFKVWDAWEINRWPTILVEYKTKKKEFFLVIDFGDESYKKVSGYELKVDDLVLFSVTGVDLTLDFFFTMSPNGELLKGSEEKCIKLIDRYWNLRAFL